MLGWRVCYGDPIVKCPHCQTAFADRDAQSVDLSTPPGEEYKVSSQLNWHLVYSYCPQCGKLIARLVYEKAIKASGGSRQITGAIDYVEILVYPKGFLRPPPPSEVPSEYADDYNEACLVLANSPKASAALSRRCLQNILRDRVGVKPSNLADEIQQVLDSNQLPSHIADDVDAIRNVGNFAAHPIKSQNTGEIISVEPQEAEWNLDVIEALFDFYFVGPVRAQARRDAYNKKLGEAGKGPMKSSNP